MGGYIAADNLLVDAIRSFAPGFIFTTALAPVLAAGALASVRHLKTSSAERNAQAKAVTDLRAMLSNAGLPVLRTPSHIVPLIVGDPVGVEMLSAALLARHALYAQPINYPTVPRGTERLRLTPGPHHTREMMHVLVGALGSCWLDTLASPEEARLPLCRSPVAADAAGGGLR